MCFYETLGTQTAMVRHCDKAYTFEEIGDMKFKFYLQENYVDYSNYGRDPDGFYPA